MSQLEKHLVTLLPACYLQGAHQLQIEEGAPRKLHLSHYQL